MGIKKICVATGSRAESGILFWLMKAIQEDKDCELQTLVMGTHLSSDHGNTANEFIQAGFPISAKIESLSKLDDKIGTCQSFSKICDQVPSLLESLRPDAVVILGDRYEMLAVAFCAYTLGIPIVHIHGGELTFGATDEAYRHSISKMALLHFASTADHAKRIIQLGECPERVFNFGAPGLDHCFKTTLLTREELEKSVKFKIKDDCETALITYHSVTHQIEGTEKDISQLLESVERSQVNAIFTKSNADAQGQKINKMVQDFCQKNPEKYIFIDSLGSLRYFSCLKHLSFMLGNTSSGIIEAGSFGMPVINIGERQKGRTCGDNVLHVKCEASEIDSAIKVVTSEKFKTKCKSVKNPYQGAEGGKISFNIKEKIKSFDFNKYKAGKVFFDVNF